MGRKREFALLTSNGRDALSAMRLRKKDSSFGEEGAKGRQEEIKVALKREKKEICVHRQKKKSTSPSRLHISRGKREKLFQHGGEEEKGHENYNGLED